METRKKYVALNRALYEQIKRLLQKESVKKIVEITGVEKSQIYKIKCFIETNPEVLTLIFLRKRDISLILKFFLFIMKTFQLILKSFQFIVKTVQFLVKCPVSICFASVMVMFICCENVSFGSRVILRISGCFVLVVFGCLI